MARKKKSSLLGVVRLLLVFVLLYCFTFLVWSRLRTFRLRGHDRQMWSFFAVPSGLAAATPKSWNEWKKREHIVAVIFWPCIVLDERWTTRRYWPAIAAEPKRLIT
jgi:hypothetical protein